MQQIGILFVCLGNICRSPTAEGIMRQLVKEHKHIFVDSAGTGDWHIGRAPNQKAQTCSLRHNIDISSLKARQIELDDFENFNHILIMDQENFINVNQIAPAHHRNKIKFLGSFSHTATQEIIDPYYSNDQVFEEIFLLMQRSCEGLLEKLINPSC